MKKRLIVSASLLVLFIILTVLIITNKTEGFDTLIYKIVTRNMSDVLTGIYKVFTFLGSTKFIVALCVLFLIIFSLLKKYKYGFIISGVLVISTIVNNVVKIIIRRPRPEVLKLVIEKTYSFPSGHTMASVSMYGILIYLIYKCNIDKKYKIPLYILLGIIPILVQLSRIYLGAHFASDVIGGFLLAFSLLLIETYIIAKKKWL